MNAKSSSKIRAFAARSGTWSSSTALASPGPRTTFASQGFSRGVDPTDEAGGDLAEGQLVAALYPLAVYGGAIQEGPVGGTEILDDEAVVRAREPRVPPRDVRVGDDDVVLLRAADGPRPAPASSVRKIRVWPEVSCGAPFSRGPSPPVSFAVMPNSPKRKESSVSKRTLGGVMRW